MDDHTELDQLVRSAQAGDSRALEEVLFRVRPLVMRRCARFLPHHQDAEEAAQDALLSISTKLGTYDGHGSFLGWVSVIASNSARSTYRSMRRRADTVGWAVKVGGADMVETADPPTTSVIAGTRLDLMEALDELERRQPVVVESFVLRDLGALPYGEIAELTAVPLGTVKDRIHQARPPPSACSPSFSTRPGPAPRTRMSGSANPSRKARTLQGRPLRQDAAHRDR